MPVIYPVFKVFNFNLIIYKIYNDFNQVSVWTRQLIAVKRKENSDCCCRRTLICITKGMIGRQSMCKHCSQGYDIIGLTIVSMVCRLLLCRCELIFFQNTMLLAWCLHKNETPVYLNQVFNRKVANPYAAIGWHLHLDLSELF